MEYRIRKINRIFQIIVVLLFSIFYIQYSTFRASAAVLYAGSAYDVVTEGQTFVVDWFLDTEGEEINVLQLNLKTSPQTLEILEAGPGNSVFSLWLQPPQFSNQTGLIQLVGGAPNGVNGKQVPVFRTVLAGKKAGTAQITMDSSSTALLNDGRGSQASLTFRVLAFLISPKGTLPAQISSPTHPDENQWYQTNRVVIKTAPDEKEIYSYSFSSNLEILPDEEPDELEEEMVFENLPDGIYYFKLNTKIGEGSWVGAGIFRVQIDSTPPEAFTPTIASDPNISAGKQFLSFVAVDKTAGISHYRVKVGFGRSKEALSPYVIKRPVIGNNILVQAFDQAGNKTQAEIEYSGLISPGQGIGLFSLLLIILGIIFKRRLWKPKHET